MEEERVLASNDVGYPVPVISDGAEAAPGTYQMRVLGEVEFGGLAVGCLGGA